MKGFVLWFSGVKGYGFIRPDDESKDIFVHYSAIVSNGKVRKTLDAGQVVTFEVAEQGNEKGRTAAEVAPTGETVEVPKEEKPGHLKRYAND